MEWKIIVINSVCRLYSYDNEIKVQYKNNATAMGTLIFKVNKAQEVNIYHLKLRFIILSNFNFLTLTSLFPYKVMI